MANRFAVIRISTFYFTNTGLIGGTPCRVTVKDTEQFIDDYAWNNRVAIDGAVATKTVVRTAGRTFEITFNMRETDFTTLWALLKPTYLSSSSVEIEVTDYPTFTANVRVNGFFRRGTRAGGNLMDVTIPFITV